VIMARRAALWLASIMCALTGPVCGAVPKAVTDMQTLVAGLQRGASFRYQIDDIAGCDLTYSLRPRQPENMVTFDVSWQLDNVFINVSASGQNTVLFTHERHVNGSRSMLDKPALRQVSVAVNADGTMDVLVTGFEFQSFFCFESYSYTCSWNTSSAAAVIYQQDDGGTEQKDLVKAVESGHNLAFVINTTDLKPILPNAHMSGLLIGRITELRWSPSNTDVVFNWKTTDYEMVSMFEVKVSTNGDSVSIFNYIYSRAKQTITSSTTYNFDIKSVHIFSLPYGE